jgi:biotin synthase
LIAVSRIVLREVHIPATTALGTVEREGREKGLRVGANVVMACLTPLKYREQYQIYPNRICVQESAERYPECLKQRITNLGRKVSQDFGHSLKGERHAA